MAKQLFYTIRRSGLYLQGIALNESAGKDQVAPTMGVRYSQSDYQTIWGKTQKKIEPLTVASYIKVILEEYRWEQIKPELITITPEKEQSPHWMDVGSSSCRCSACGCKNNRETPFCPNCGAEMKGGNDGERI